MSGHVQATVSSQQYSVGVRLDSVDDRAGRILLQLSAVDASLAEVRRRLDALERRAGSVRVPGGGSALSFDCGLLCNVFLHQLRGMVDTKANKASVVQALESKASKKKTLKLIGELESKWRRHAETAAVTGDNRTATAQRGIDRNLAVPPLV